MFIKEGFIALPDIIPKAICEQVLDILWSDLPVDREDPSTWNQPVIRLGDYSSEPFRAAANLPSLHAAFNQLAGEDQWLPRRSLGTFPIRFPSSLEPADTGWHVDASFPGDNPGDFLSWRINVQSKGRALLMLFLFSDVGCKDAPTRILPSSHLNVAEILSSYGEEGLSFLELGSKLTCINPSNIVHATGTAGTVYLCHPFIVHAAQAHSGRQPRFMAQPPLQMAGSYNLNEAREKLPPVAQAIKIAVTRNQ